jgi:predicted Zn-dependent peptidase
VFFVYGNVDFKRLVKNLQLTVDGLNSCDPALASGKAERTDYTLGRKDDGLANISSVSCKQSTVNREIGTHQAHVMLGTRAYRYENPRRMTLYLLNNIIGGPGMNARLNLSLRERHGLVYTVESSMAAYSDTGVWSVYFGCDHHDINRCLRLVRKELDRVMLRPLSASQLMAAKRQLKGQLAIACDNREQFALDFGRNYLHHGYERDLDILFGKIDAVTAEDIRQVAGELFPAENLTTLIFK